MMNKKYFLQAMAMMLGVVLSVSFVSCGDDDEDDSGSSTPAVSNSVLSSRLKDVNGKTLLLTACGGYEYKYSNNGALYECGGRPYEVDGLTYKCSYSGTNIEGSFNLNRDGLVSKANCKIEEFDRESGILEWVCNWEFSYSYNAEKQLQKVEATTHQQDCDESGTPKSNGEEHAVLTYTWANGNLEKVVTTTQDVGYVSDHFFHPSVYTFTYGNELNVTRQPVRSLEIIEDAGMIDVHMLGLFGIGPRNFPISYTLEKTEEDGDTYKGSESISFTLNDDGSINTETVSRYDAYQYTYMK
mgnify:CR=1 FL=1